MTDASTTPASPELLPVEQAVVDAVASSAPSATGSEAVRLVPVEPTDEMLSRVYAISDETGEDPSFERAWSAMLAASPRPDTPARDGGEREAGPFEVSRSSDGEAHWFSARDPAAGVTIPAKDRESAYAMVGSLNRAFSHHLAILAPASGEEREAHADDLAVDRFATKMKAKLAAAREKGRGGWDDPDRCDPDVLRPMLHDHIRKGDPVDVANFAMMLDYYGASTAGVTRARVKCDRPGCDWGDGRAALAQDRG